MKRARRIILPIVMAVLLTIITCISIFAYSPLNDILDVEPADIGDESPSYPSIDYDILKKYYIVLTPNTSDTAFGIKYIMNDGTERIVYDSGVTINNGRLIISQTNVYSNNSYLMIPYINIEYDSTKTYYIPVFCMNSTIYYVRGWAYKLYLSTTTDNTELMRQYYEIGYQTGYNNGYRDADNSEEYTNITGYVTNLLSKFVGSEYAEYLTPISIVLVILLVYFLFIRFLLSLIKAKGIIKTCDIIMIVACIILLVIMYAPKLNLTIKTEQVTTETTSTTISENVEIVRTREYETIHTETGDIWVGPAGTILFPDVETTDSGQRATESVDVSTSTEGERE